MMQYLYYSLSLSLSLSQREYRSINKKFHKTSKIKNIRIMFLKSYLSRGVALGRASLAAEEREEMTNREGVATGGAT